jgi:hypothetical protein
MTDKIGTAGRAVIGALLQAFDAAKQQLPVGMRECTILFFECEKGHGRLTATNWVQHDCQQCKIEALERAGDVLAHQLMYRDHKPELSTWWALRAGACTYCNDNRFDKEKHHGG